MDIYFFQGGHYKNVEENVEVLFSMCLPTFNIPVERFHPFVSLISGHFLSTITRPVTSPNKGALRTEERVVHEHGVIKS